MNIRDISSFSVSKVYSCCKITVNDTLTQYKEKLSPVSRKTGRPRESYAGKYHETPKRFKPFPLCAHSIARNKTYKETTKICECSESPVRRIIKTP